VEALYNSARCKNSRTISPETANPLQPKKSLWIGERAIREAGAKESTGKIDRNCPLTREVETGRIKLSELESGLAEKQIDKSNNPFSKDLAVPD
jgi:hypothetical protein